jgi:hypothetical protein
LSPFGLARFAADENADDDAEAKEQERMPP